MAERKTILIVDDEAMVRRLLASTLTRAGYAVEQASNGEQAWEWLISQRPDALITDIDMPRMTGEELCLQIARAQPERDYPIFVVTSKTAIEHRSWSRDMDDVQFVEKPMSMRKLVDQLARRLAAPAPSASTGSAT